MKSDGQRPVPLHLTRAQRKKVSREKPFIPSAAADFNRLGPPTPQTLQQPFSPPELCFEND
jgi:hypothetical protein